MVDGFGSRSSGRDTSSSSYLTRIKGGRPGGSPDVSCWDDPGTCSVGKSLDVHLVTGKTR